MNNKMCRVRWRFVPSFLFFCAAEKTRGGFQISPSTGTRVNSVLGYWPSDVVVQSLDVVSCLAHYTLGELRPPSQPSFPRTTALRCHRRDVAGRPQPSAFSGMDHFVGIKDFSLEIRKSHFISASNLSNLTSLKQKHRLFVLPWV